MLSIIFSKQRPEPGGPALFIDRDGVINCRRPDDYVLDWSQFVFLPGIPEALRQLSTLGLPMIVISNQSAVGKGLLGADVLEGITNQLRNTLGAEGVFLNAAYYCPHRVDEHCGCRKPKPGLLYRAAEDFCLDLSRSVFIGDSETDVRAAQAAGCKPLLFGPGLCVFSSRAAWASDVPAARTAADLFGAVASCIAPL